MLKGFARAVSSAGKGGMRMGMESMESAPKAISKPAALMEKAPISARVIAAANDAEATAQEQTPREGLTKLEKFNKVKDDFQEATKAPLEPIRVQGDGFHFVSKTLEESSEALPGGKAEDVVRSDPHSSR